MAQIQLSPQQQHPHLRRQPYQPRQQPHQQGQLRHSLGIFSFSFSLLISWSRTDTLLLSRNFAFTDALQQHLAKLSPDENFAFRNSHQTLTAESILVKVRDYDRDWNHNSNSRKCAEQVEKSLRILNQFLRSIAIAIQSNPEISSLIVGGVRLILDVINSPQQTLLVANFLVDIYSSDWTLWPSSPNCRIWLKSFLTIYILSRSLITLLTSQTWFAR